MRPLTFLVLLSAASACDSVGEGRFVEVTTSEDAEARVVALRNQGSASVYFLIMDEDDGARMDMDLSRVTDGPAVAPGVTVRVPYEDIAFYDPGDTRGWIYWTTGEGDGETLRVTLRP